MMTPAEDRCVALRQIYHAWQMHCQVHGVPTADVTHLWAWQQITQARLRAALAHTPPTYPLWPTADPDSEHEKDAINAWIQTTHGQVSADAAYARWEDGFATVLALAESVPEALWDDPRQVPWLHGHVLYDVIIGTIEHHREHLEEMGGT